MGCFKEKKDKCVEIGRELDGKKNKVVEFHSTRQDFDTRCKAAKPSFLFYRSSEVLPKQDAAEVAFIRSQIKASPLKKRAAKYRINVELLLSLPIVL